MSVCVTALQWTGDLSRATLEKGKWFGQIDSLAIATLMGKTQHIFHLPSFGPFLLACSP